MTARTIRVGIVRRVTNDGEVDEIYLNPGVNVLVGHKDTGKTGWLHTLSFLLGDTDPPEKSLGAGIASRFDSASLQLVVGGTEEITLERRWKDPNSKHKIFVNGQGILSSEFSKWFQGTIGVPILRFPRGNPYSGAWPELSWRMLFRHVYREERFWSDVADKQPEREQHACLLQFLGGAEKLYPKELGEEVTQREDLLKLRARKEQFEEVLQQAARGLLLDSSISNAPTIDAIDRGVERLRGEIAGLQGGRQQLILDALASRGSTLGVGLPSDMQLSERRLQLTVERDRADNERSAAVRRLEELSSYKVGVTAELTRISRVEVAGEAFRPLSVRRCPHCDQKVTADMAAPGTCFVCHQHLPDEFSKGWAGARGRLTFERDQLEGENAELAELVQKLIGETAEIKLRLRNLDQEIAAIDVLLRPARAAVAAVLPPSLGVLDTKVGQLEERAAQLLRLRDAIGQRDALSHQIDELAEKVQVLAGETDRKSGTIPFAQISDVITDGINEYLNLLNEGDSTRWMHKPVRFQISERSFKLMVGDVHWSSVGATSAGLVVLGYHYALLKLSGHDDYNYPGLALIDFPMMFADGASVGGKENYLVEPFVSLAHSNASVQVVICGRAFRALKDVNRIPLTKVWTQGEGAALAAPAPDNSPPATIVELHDSEASAQASEVSTGLELVGSANFHSNEKQIMIVLSPSETNRLSDRIPELAAAIAEDATWAGRDVRVVWSGGSYVTKLIHHIDIKVVKFTIRKKDARPLWNYLNTLLRTQAPKQRRVDPGS